MKFVDIVKKAVTHGEAEISRLSWNGNMSTVKVKDGKVHISDGSIYSKDLDGDDWIPNKVNSTGLYPCGYKCHVDTKAILYFHSHNKVEVRCIECDGVTYYDVFDILVNETKLHPIIVDEVKEYYNGVESCWNSMQGK